MRITQGAFSFLPDLNDAQIKKQVKTKAVIEPRYLAFENGYVMMLKYLVNMPKREYGLFDAQAD